MKFNLNLASRRFANTRAVTLAFGLILCVMLLLCGWDLKQLLSDNQALDRQQGQISAIRQHLSVLRGGAQKTLTKAERNQLESEHEVIAQLLGQDAFRWTALLDRMEKLLPADVSLSGFVPDYKKKSLVLTGRATSIKKMRTFLDRLLKQGGFKEVYLEKHGRVKVRDYANVERAAIGFSLKIEGVF